LAIRVYGDARGARRCRNGFGPVKTWARRAFVLSRVGSVEPMLEQMTRDAYQRLLEQLERLENDERQDIAEAIRYARGFGDITENAEYQAALDDQARLEGRIAKLRRRLEKAVVVDDASVEGAAGVVRIGSLVEVEDDAGQRLSVRIATPDDERDVATPGSPLGRAVLGARVGEVVDVKAPRGTWRARVVGVR
jgi:transcription elongation factor GreA